MTDQAKEALSVAALAQVKALMAQPIDVNWDKAREMHPDLPWDEEAIARRRDWPKGGDQC